MLHIPEDKNSTLSSFFSEILTAATLPHGQTA